VVNPVEQIDLARRRLKRIAVVRAGLTLAIPALTALGLAAGFDQIRAGTWERMGYQMAPQVFVEVRAALLAAGLILAAACGWIAWRAYRRTDDFLNAAEQIDAVVGGRQEIITLANLADPPTGEQARSLRTSLFPILWQRATRYLERFDASRAFRFEIRRPLLRSLPIAAALVIALAAAAMALVQIPSAEQLQARKLRDVAREIAESPAPGSRELSSRIRAAAQALENPKLPPEEKIAKLNELMHELEKQQRLSSSSGTGNQQGKGSGQGNGSSGQGSGGGQGSGPGEGSNPNGPKGNQQMIELRNDLSKAQAQLEAKAASQSNTPKAGEGGNGTTLKPGKNPNEKGPSEELKLTGKANLPKPEERGQSQSGGARNAGKDKGEQGDTHLGEFPSAEKFQRYTIGKGPAIQVRDARYVLFRLPTEAVSSNGGQVVPDQGRPSATVPYVNVPLKAERLEVPPDERQLVPPRYRDLIH
jgi:hypothetical protein